jgi:hypothetical protein
MQQQKLAWHRRSVKLLLDSSLSFPSPAAQPPEQALAPGREGGPSVLAIAQCSFCFFIVNIFFGFVFTAARNLLRCTPSRPVLYCPRLSDTSPPASLVACRRDWAICPSMKRIFGFPQLWNTV